MLERAAATAATRRLPKSCSEQAGFELFEKIGEDEHGTLYKGRDRRKRLVMVRSLKKPVTLGGPGAFARLEKELKRLKHPAIVPILKLIGESRIGRVTAVVSEYSRCPDLVSTAQPVRSARSP